MEQKEKSLSFNKQQAVDQTGRNSAKEDWDRLGHMILDAAKQELYLSMRYLFQALNSLEYQQNRQVPFVATDGSKLYFNPMILAVRYRDDPVQINRAFLHMVMHCLFRNIYSYGNRNHEIWDLACDIMAEYLLDSIELTCVLRPESDQRNAIYKEAERSCKIMSAENIYYYLQNMPKERLAELLAGSLFTVDDHSMWYHDDDSEDDDKKHTQQDSEQENKWNDTAKKMQTEMTSFGSGRGDTKGNFLKTLMANNHKRVSYRDFLRKFAIMKEEMHVDIDAFDYGFYNYGMQLYGNMPLIEELEYREENKIEDFVIVLDTSGSCAYDLIQKFLNTTFAILTESESFFQKINLHIVQCDNQIQSDTIIKKLEDVEQFKDNFQVKGFGGTDFRPAFQYISQKQRSGELGKLRGMLYFTDGYGIYPVQKPAFDTAFVFIGEYDSSVKVPGWAMRVEISEEQLNGGNYGH